MGQLVKRVDHEGLSTLILNRPEKLNALTVDLFGDLRKHITTLQNDDSVQCVVLRGEGKCFSAGHDLEDISGGEEVSSNFWHSETLRMMEKLPKPVIAAVHGHCYTGALEVALAADMIIASSNARFADTHAKFALVPIWGMSQRLPRRVGIATAKRLMFTGETINAEEALRIGLCEMVFPEDEFLDQVESITRAIIKNSPFSHAANKRLLEATESMPIDAGLLKEVMETEGTGPDMHERIRAFFRS